MNARDDRDHASVAAERLQHCAERYRGHLAVLAENLRSAGLDEGHFGPYVRELELQCYQILAHASISRGYGLP